jgi:Integrase zinc binding domain
MEDLRFREKTLCYIIKSGILYRRVIRDSHPYLLLVVPKKIQLDLIEEAHDLILCGHLGISPTFERIKDRYFFPGSLSKVARHVATCSSCQHRAIPRTKPGGYLQPLPVSGPFVRVHLDFCGPFPVSQRRNTYLILAFCPLTEFIMARAVPAATAAHAAHFLCERVILTHGCVKKILTDRGSHFCGSMMQQIRKLLNIKHLLTTS